MTAEVLWMNIPLVTAGRCDADGQHDAGGVQGVGIEVRTRS